MNRSVRTALVLLLVLAIGVLAALIVARQHDSPLVFWLSRPNQTVNLNDKPPSTTSAAKPVDTATDARALAIAAVVGSLRGQTGFGGGLIQDVAFDDDPRNAYAPYACTLGTFADDAHWLITVPIVVKTTYIDYRTSYLVKVSATDGHILQLTKALGYRRIY